MPPATATDPQVESSYPWFPLGNTNSVEVRASERLAIDTIILDTTHGLCQLALHDPWWSDQIPQDPLHLAREQAGITRIVGSRLGFYDKATILSHTISACDDQAARSL